jgi:hypothetical protein
VTVARLAITAAATFVSAYLLATLALAFVVV